MDGGEEEGRRFQGFDGVFWCLIRKAIREPESPSENWKAPLPVRGEGLCGQVMVVGQARSLMTPDTIIVAPENSTRCLANTIMTGL